MVAFDRIWVMWARNGVGARVSSTTDGGTTWSPVEVVPGPFNSLSTDFNIGATTTGYAFVGWFDRSPNDMPGADARAERRLGADHRRFAAPE